MSWDFLLGPVVGGIIGYITNSIAIKMLFRPLKPIYILGKKLPFTPGLIPKEKKRIAKTIGNVVSREIMNEEVLSQTLLKEEVCAQITSKIDELFEQCKTSSQTVEEKLSNYIGKERLIYLKCESEELATQKIYEAILNMSLSKIMVEQLAAVMHEGKLGSVLGPLSVFLKGNMADHLMDKMEPIISEIIKNQSEPIIRKAVESESQNIMKMPLRDVAVKLEVYKKEIKETLIKAYKSLIQTQLGKTLGVLHFDEVVEERINSYDSLKLEKLIFEMMNQELKAIIWLGALLGAVLGCVMNFV